MIWMEGVAAKAQVQVRPPLRFTYQRRKKGPDRYIATKGEYRYPSWG